MGVPINFLAPLLQTLGTAASHTGVGIATLLQGAAWKKFQEKQLEPTTTTIGPEDWTIPDLSYMPEGVAAMKYYYDPEAEKWYYRGGSQTLSQEISGEDVRTNANLSTDQL